MTTDNISSSPTICGVCSFVIYTVLLTIFFRWILMRRKLYALSWKLPGPMGLPFLGNVCPKIQDVPTLLKRFEDETKKYSSPYRLWYGTKLVVVFTNPEQIKSVLTECYIPGKPGLFYYWSLGLGTGLYTAHGGGTWRRNRLLMNKAFEDFSIQHYQTSLNKQAKKMAFNMQRLVGEGAQDIDFHAQRLCFDVIAETLFKEHNPRFQEDNLDQFIKRFSKISQLVQKRASTCWLRNSTIYYYTEEFGLVEKNKCVLQNVVKDLHRRRKEEFMQTKNTRSNKNQDIEEVQTPIDIMLEAQYTGNRPFDEEILDEIINMYQASVTPTAACICFFLLMLGMHRDIQEKLYQEISMYNQGKKSNDVIVEDLYNLRYLDMCMKEVMRMFPGNAYFAREVSEDVEMDDGTFLPSGTNIVIPNLMINMSPTYWNDPNTFDPERFSSQNSANRHPYTFLPFGAGPRNCIGQQLGANIVKTTVIHLLTRYSFHTDMNMKDLKLYVDMVTVKQENGYPIQIMARD